MDLALLNKMIIEHLRHYGYQVAARIVESEIKANASRIVDKPSKLFDLATKPSQSPDPPIHHGEFLSISTKTGESSVKSGNKNITGSKNDSGTMDSEVTSLVFLLNSDSHFPHSLGWLVKMVLQDLNRKQSVIPNKLKQWHTYSVILLKSKNNFLFECRQKKDHPDAKDHQSTSDEKIPNSSDVYSGIADKTKGNDDSYKYGGQTQDHFSQTRGRNFDPYSTKHTQPVRLPLLDASRNHSTEYTSPLSHHKGQNHHMINNNANHDGGLNNEGEDESRKVRDPHDLNLFVPYSYNKLDRENNISNNSKGQRSISVPQRKEQFYEQENSREPNHEHRNPKPLPASDHFIPRMTTPLKPLSNPNQKLYLAHKKVHDEEFQLPISLHPTSLDYSILNREAELLPAAAEINARRGTPQRSPIKPGQHKQPTDSSPSEQRDTKPHKQFQVSTFTTRAKTDKSALHVTIKEPSDPDHVPFQKPDNISRTLNATNPLLKNANFESSRDLPAQNGRNTHYNDNQTRRNDQNHSVSHLSFERQSLVVFKPSPNAIDKSDSIKYPLNSSNKEIFIPTHNRTDFLQDFGDSMKRQPKSNWIGKNPEEQNNYHLSDSFGPDNWERAKQATQHQIYNPAMQQHGTEKGSFYDAKPEAKISQHLHSKTQPPQRELSDREHAFDPFEHTLYSNKNKLPNSEQLVDMYGQDQQDSNSQQNQIHYNVDLNHKTLEYLKDTTKLTEKEIREHFNVYVQILNPNVNPDLQMNREKFIEYMRKVRGIASPSFSETCFDFAIAAFTNERDTEYITFREVGHLLDLMHPEHPYAFMKLLFKLYQGEEKHVHIRELEAPLKGISSGQLYEISLLLRSSLDYVYERLKTTEVKLSFEEYLGYMQDYEPMKIYS